MERMISAVEDSRDIELIWQSNVSEIDASIFRVGVSGITKIVLYQENGQMAAITWAAIYKDDFLMSRLDISSGWGITYKES